MRIDVALLLVGIAATFLAGLGWTVQTLVYPTFLTVGAAVSPADWLTFHQRHSRRIASVVGFPWLVQGLATAALVLAMPEDTRAGHAAIDLLILLSAATVLITVVGALPAHRRLARGFSADTVRGLLRADLLRTLAWTACSLLAVAITLLRATYQ